MYPEQLVVEPGGSQVVNCSTSCANPNTGGLETTLSKTLIQSKPQWKQFLVSNISQDTVVHCYFSCFGSQKLKSLNVSVFCECCPVGPSSPGRARVCCMQSYPGHSLWPPPPGAPGVTGSQTRPWAWNLLTTFPGFLKPAGHASSAACSEDSPGKVCTDLQVISALCSQSPPHSVAAPSPDNPSPPPKAGCQQKGHHAL